MDSLERLKKKHRELDEAVGHLEDMRNYDRTPEGKLHLTDLKKQRLALKEQIHQLSQ